MMDGVEPLYFPGYPGVQFVNRDVAHLIHEEFFFHSSLPSISIFFQTLDIEQVFSLDTQAFLDLLQRMAEEQVRLGSLS